MQRQQQPLLALRKPQQPHQRPALEIEWRLPLRLRPHTRPSGNNRSSNHNRCCAKEIGYRRSSAATESGGPQSMT
jgi:hypothetical protein